jgi:hypothetical protein
MEIAVLCAVFLNSSFYLLKAFLDAEGVVADGGYQTIGVVFYVLVYLVYGVVPDELILPVRPHPDGRDEYLVVALYIHHGHEFLGGGNGNR